MRARLRPMTRRRGILCVTLLGAACSGCGGGSPGTSLPAPPPMPPPPPATSLVVVPAEIFSAAGASFEVHVLALDAGSDPAAPPSSLTWQTDDPSVTVTPSSSGERAVVTIPTDYTVDADGGFEVRVSSGTLPSSPAVVSVATGSTASTGSGGDRVQLPPTAGAPPMALVLDADDHDLATCEQDMRWNVTGSAALGRNLDQGSCTDPEEVAVFSADHAMLFEAHNGSTVTTATPGSVPPWTAQGDLMTRSSLSAQNEVPVRIRVWVADSLDTSVVGSAPYEAAELPSTLFGEARTGMRFTAVDTLDGGMAKSFDISNCHNTTFLASVGVDLTKDSLYVVYVQDIVPNVWKGWTCVRMPADNGVVTFISASAKSPTTAAHELGHIMGLSAPLPKDGHSGSTSLPLWGFDYTNLMWVGEEGTRALPRTGFTLGQAFRMNLDRHSWLAKLRAPDGGARQCQCGVYDTGVCPIMSLSVMKVGPRPSSYPDPVCTADPWGP